MGNKNEITQRLEKWILDNFRTKVEFCKKTGMSTQSLNMYLSGRTGIGSKFLSRLRDEGCDVEWLVSGRSESPPAIKLEITESSPSDNLLLVEVMNRVIALENKGKRLEDEIQELKTELEIEKQKQPGQTAVSVEK